MSNTEIKEKYGIEPIMKEMWVWDSDKSNAFLQLVLLRINNDYLSVDTTKRIDYWTNASETNPKDKEVKVGDKGYFWFNNDDSYFYGELYSIFENSYLSGHGYYPNFSHEKQPWME